MSLDRLELRLAQLLSTTEVPVQAGAPGSGTGPRCGLAVERIQPRGALGSRLPELVSPSGSRRVSGVLVHAAATVAAGTGGDARAEALDAATDLWWRCEDDAVAAGFVPDASEGYRVLAVRPVAWTTPDGPEARAEHRIELEVEAVVWPRELAPAAGEPITHALLRLAPTADAAAGSTADPRHALRVHVGTTVRIPVEVDLRTLALGAAQNRPAPPARRLTVTVTALDGDIPAGAVTAPTAELTGGRALLEYTAGAVAGRDVIHLALDGGSPMRVGSVLVEVLP
jgi:hypothetical protein